MSLTERRSVVSDRQKARTTCVPRDTFRMMTLQQSVENKQKGDKTRLPRTSLALDSHSRTQTCDTKILGKEEMRDLRKQLLTEAENIARWKASTEVKSKNMEREIKDKQGIIDDQRRNLMELQLHSEHLSQSLFQERQEKDLVNSKVGHTRQLFLTLQEQYEQLSETVSNFQSCKDEMQKEHDDISEKLVDLKKSYELQEEVIEDMISKALENVSNLKNARDSWEKSILKKDQEIKDLNIQLETLNEAAKQLSKHFENTKLDLSSAENTRDQLSSELDKVNASLYKTQEELKELKESLTDHITRKDQDLKLAHEQLEERTKEFEEAAEKIQYLKKVNDTLEGTKSELTERVTALATRKQELEKEINYKENVIQTLETTQNKSLIEINELSERLNDMYTQLSVAENQRSSLELERNSVAEKLESSRKKLIKKKKLLEQFKEQVATLQTDLEAKKEENIQLEEKNKNKEEINQNLEINLNEVNKKIIMCNDTINDMTQKILMTENHEAELEEEKKKVEEDLEKVSSDLKTKTLECDNLAAALNQLKLDMKMCEKECETKIKNASSETKSKRLLDQKINGLEEKLKKSTKSVENLEAELKANKNLLSEKEKEIQNLQVSLDKALCEKQEIQYKYEAKDESFKSYQSFTTTSIETLQKELNDSKEELEKIKNEHEQKVLHLQTELDETRESLNLSNIAHGKQLQETTEAFHEKHNNSRTECQKEVTTLKEKLEAVINELEQAKQEASAAIKDKLQIKLESDNKVKEMGELLNIYKTDKETKLKNAEEELQKSKSQIERLMQEKDELLTRTRTHIADTTATVKSAVTQVTELEDPSLKTPSPSTYLKAMNAFAEPSIPPVPRASAVARRTEANKFQEKQPISGILKTGRRTLLPPEYQKRVVFKPLTPNRDYASGDSSSDACAFEIADSDDPFEEIKRARQYPGVRSERVPRANVAPFITETIPIQKTNLPLKELNEKKELNEALAIGSSRRKRGRSEQKQSLKTYSTVSPKNKQIKAE